MREAVCAVRPSGERRCRGVGGVRTVEREQGGPGGGRCRAATLESEG